MYEDVYSLTDRMFSVAKKNKQKSKMRSVYDVYRNIQQQGSRTNRKNERDAKRDGKSTKRV